MARSLSLRIASSELPASLSYSISRCNFRPRCLQSMPCMPFHQVPLSSRLVITKPDSGGCHGHRSFWAPDTFAPRPVARAAGGTQRDGSRDLGSGASASPGKNAGPGHLGVRLGRATATIAATYLARLEPPLDAVCHRQSHQSPPAKVHRNLETTDTRAHAHIELHS
jgi:hypothetical protein